MDNETENLFSAKTKEKRVVKKKCRRARKVDTDWSSEMSLNLINFVESKPNLWNISNNDYKNRNSREAAWKEIAAKMHLSKDEVSNKWNLLRQQFRNACNKAKETKNGRSTSAQKSPNPFYIAMLFLEPVLSMDSGNHSTNCKMSTDSEESMSTLDTQIVHNEMSNDELHRLSSSSYSVKPRVKRRKKAETNIQCNTLIKKAFEFLNDTKEEDEFEIWGRSIAATLRNYPDGIAVRMAKSKINKVMASLEAGELDRPVVNKFKRK